MEEPHKLTKIMLNLKYPNKLNSFDKNILFSMFWTENFLSVDIGGSGELRQQAIHI